jgi:hydrogenase expression/formation protein HypC
MCLGIPGIITEVYESGSLHMGKVDFGGVLREVCLEAVPEAQVGSYTIVHAGFALNILSEEEARLTLEALQELGEVEKNLSDLELSAG